MGDKKIVRGASENCHTEDNSPKYRMVGNDVWLENLTYRCNCPPELGATHVAHFYSGALIEQNGWKIPKDYPVRL